MLDLVFTVSVGFVVGYLINDLVKFLIDKKRDKNKKEFHWRLK